MARGRTLYNKGRVYIQSCESDAFWAGFRDQKGRDSGGRSQASVDLALLQVWSHSRGSCGVHTVRCVLHSFAGMLFGTGPTEFSLGLGLGGGQVVGPTSNRG